MLLRAICTHLRTSCRSHIYSPRYSFSRIVHQTIKQTERKVSQKNKDQRGQAFLAKKSSSLDQKVQEIMSELGKDLFQYLSFKIGASRVDVSSMLVRTQQRLKEDNKNLTILHLINYVEIVKHMVLNKMENIDDIVEVYRELAIFMKTSGNMRLLSEHCKDLQDDKVSLIMRIRSAVLLQFMGEAQRQKFLEKLVPLVRYLKMSDLSVLMLEKHLYDYPYSYKLLNQIFDNQHFVLMEDINLSFIKMLFLEKLKGIFIPSDDGIFFRTLYSVLDKKSFLLHSSLDKIVKILIAQSYFVQTEGTRLFLQGSLNIFINIAKSHNFGPNSIGLDQLIALYLGFQETHSTGEILLSQITFTSKTTGFQIQQQHLPLYLRLLRNVLKNCEPRLKYERVKSMKKEYTIDTLAFLEEFLPKFIPLFPEVIFEVNSVRYDLFQSDKDSPLLTKFQEVFNSILTKHKSKLGIKQQQITSKILELSFHYQKFPGFNVQTLTLKNIFQDIIKTSQDRDLTNQELQLTNFTLQLLESRLTAEEMKNILSEFNTNYIEKQMENELRTKQKGFINSMDDNVIWLALINAKARKYDCQTNKSIVEAFTSEKLFCMVNSLSYNQVYEILVYVISLSQPHPRILQRLLNNLSTFIIYIDDQSARKSPFFLNHRYQELYIPIVKLVLANRKLFHKITDRSSLKVIQLILVKYIDSFSNIDILHFLQILVDTSFLSVSLHRHLEELKFLNSQLVEFKEESPIRNFMYYNKSLLRHFQGKYNEVDIKARLKQGNLTHSEIQECFSNIEVYKTIIMDGDIDINFDLPQPRTKNPDIKSMYSCQQIFSKISSQNDFSFNLQSIENPLSQLDLTTEKRYILDELLVIQTSEDDFKIGTRALPMYLKMELWQSYSFFERELMVQPKDLFLDSKKFSDEILNKIMKGVLGKFEKIKETVREFNCNQEFALMLQNANIPFQKHGASLQFKGPNDKSFTVICTNPSNHKILTICAYFMKLNNVKVVILKEGETFLPLFEYLQVQFPEVDEEELDVKKGESEEEEDQ